MSAVDLREAHEAAAELVWDDDPLNASYWYLAAAAICIRRGGQDVIVADVLEAMQRFMADESIGPHLADDRALLMSIVEHYDAIAPA